MEKPGNRRPILLRNGKLVLPGRVETGDLLVEGDRIVALGEVPGPADADLVDLGGDFLVAGFIDIHHHGALGFDYSLGRYDEANRQFDLEPETYREGVVRALRYFLERGATRVFPTSLAAPMEDLEVAFSQIKALVEDPAEPLRGMIGGINVEGTFLKLPEYAGAQSPEYFFPPTQAHWNRLKAAAGDLIRLVNLPPEHGAEGLALIRRLTGQGVVVSAGHTGAEADLMQEAIAAGTRLGVHFFNGPSRSSSKSFHDGGAEEALLRSDAVSLELIVDGYHVHPAYARDVMARKGFGRVILITDSMFVNGCTAIDRFQLCGVPGAVSANGEYLQVTDRADTLFGSVLTSLRGFENVVNWLTRPMTGIWHRQHPAYSLEEALVHSSRMASANPASLMGLDGGEAPTGTLEPGKQADLVRLSIGGGEEGYRLAIKGVWLGGRQLVWG